MCRYRTLIAMACVALLGTAHAQNVPCPGEPLVFQLEGENHGTKTWEHSANGVTWNMVEVVENEAFTLQPEQSGWYRVRYHDEDCDISYVSEAQRFVTHAIELGDALTLTIGGVVRNELGGPVSGATVRAGCGAGVSTTTDHFGVFLLEGIAAYEGLAQVTVEKEGYFTGSRSFVPSETAEEAISHAYITLLKKNLAGTVQSADGGQVMQEGVTITFPVNGFVQNGQLFNGPVSVYLNHIDPTSAELHAQMPGMLMGVMNDEPQLMLSYGMVGVELTDSLGQALQLAPGSAATVRFPVLASQQSTAPATIPLWWFDEDLGYWIQEGEAQREGNEYVGQVAHFSWWNVDVPGYFVELHSMVFDSIDLTVLAGARIMVVTETMGTIISYVDTQGGSTCLVPGGQQLTITVELPCGAGGSLVTVHEQSAGPYTQPSVISISVTIPDQKLVTGTVVDCDGLPVDDGYVLVNGAMQFCENGAFEVLTCASSINLRGVDASNTHVSEYTFIELSTDTTDVGEMVACTPMLGVVTDIEGNIYRTVIIGDQEWMAENLRTTTFANGDSIPHVPVGHLQAPNGNAWTLIFGEGWCNYENNEVHDLSLGKLYNFYTVQDIRNVCPQGWHVPDDLEWQELELALGMPLGEVNGQGSRGETENVGGKLKSPALWNVPETGVINESAFSGLPGGFRSHSTGSFFDLGDTGNWWCATLAAAQNGWSRFVYNSNPGVSRYYVNWRYGLSVRCVRD